MSADPPERTQSDEAVDEEGPNDDFRLLLEAARRVHGYHFFRWLESYLTWIYHSLYRLYRAEALGPDGRPSPETDYRISFDPAALDRGLLLDVLGLYVYLVASHKWTNVHLTAETDRKRVLYLRGFDFEGALAVGGGTAMGTSSMDTTGFNQIMAKALGGQFDVFKAMSPRDLHSESIGAQHRFRDLDALQDYGNRPIRSFYVHAHHWKADIDALMDRVDFVIVYLSSITPSVLWEIDTLKSKGRAPDTTIVFDQGAIDSKANQPDLGDLASRDEFDELRWRNSKTGPPSIAPEELRARLAQDFLVLTPDEFEDQIEEQKQRISASAGPRPDESRGRPIPFRFSPALGASEMDRLRALADELGREIRSRLGDEPIENLPWFLNRVQLKLFTSVLLGRHEEVGSALAVYAGVHKALLDHEIGGDAVRDHFGMADYYGPHLVAFGKDGQLAADSWDGILDRHEALVAVAGEAVGEFLAEVRRRGG